VPKLIRLKHDRRDIACRIAPWKELAMLAPTSNGIRSGSNMAITG
jgi:hypothetical protein